jgi:hypothetical protein
MFSKFDVQFFLKKFYLATDAILARAGLFKKMCYRENEFSDELAEQAFNRFSVVFLLPVPVDCSLP